MFGEGNFLYWNKEATLNYASFVNTKYYLLFNGNQINKPYARSFKYNGKMCQNFCFTSI